MQQASDEMFGHIKTTARNTLVGRKPSKRILDPNIMFRLLIYRAENICFGHVIILKTLYGNFNHAQKVHNMGKLEWFSSFRM